MAITYTWTINSVFLKDQGSTAVGANFDEGVEVDLTKFIQSIDVTITGTDGTHSSTFDTTAHLWHDPDVLYTAYENVTTSNLIAWAQNALPSGIVGNIHNQITREIEDQKTSTGRIAWAG